MATNDARPYPLNQSPLFKMTSRKKLALEVFNVDLRTLESLAHNESNFRVFKLKQGEKERQVEVPKVVLERFHRRLFTLLERLEKPDYLHSGRKGRSYVTNAKVHLGEVPLAKVDLKKFYPSVDGARVARFFTELLQCSPDVAGLLTKLCVYENHVPTGSCVSQLLAYFAVSPLFNELSTLSMDSGVRMTCYVDDMTFSGPTVGPAFLWAAKQVIHRHGFRYHKERCYRSDEQKFVTGAMLHGQRITMLASREHALARDINALGGLDPVARLDAIDRLMGKAVAGSQIDARFLARVKRLRQEKAQARAAHERLVEHDWRRRRASELAVAGPTELPWLATR